MFIKNDATRYASAKAIIKYNTWPLLTLPFFIKRLKSKALNPYKTKPKLNIYTAIFK